MTSMKLGIVLAVVLFVALPVMAHHPFSVEFDWKKPVTVSGIVTKFDWENPHAYMRLNVQDPNGVIRSWNFEMGALNALRKAGWTRETVKAGDRVSIAGWLARSPGKPTTANLKTIRLANGRELSGASSAGETEPHEPVERNASN